MSETPTRTTEFAQERSRRTYEALLEAAADLFAERGYDKTGSPDIAARANVSVGTFYRYFEDKKVIYLEVMQRRLESAQAEVFTGLTPGSLRGADRRQTILRAIQLAVHLVSKHRSIYRLLLEMSLRDDDVLALRQRFERQARKHLAALIEEVGSPSMFTDPATAAYTIHHLVLETAVAIVIRGDEPEAGQDHCLLALTDLVHRALFGETGVPSQD